MSPSKPQQRRVRTLYADQHTPGQHRPEPAPTFVWPTLKASIGERCIARQLNRIEMQRER